ncbi:hypothetical protein N0V86_002009 [Didymella sp. IMI 355093]|nr:hypothetical protein N0V86_002009 [Didymella sp. IMI 355093]
MHDNLVLQDSMFHILMWTAVSAAILFFVTVALARWFRGPSHCDVEANNLTDEKRVPIEVETPQIRIALPDYVLDSSADRDAWVLRVTQHVFDDRHRGFYNVLVINEELEYFFSPEGVVEEMYADYYETKVNGEKTNRRKITYRVSVFESGSLVNLGDGGDINWDWKGNFDRTSTATLTFKPCIAGVHYQQDPWQATG